MRARRSFEVLCVSLVANNMSEWPGSVLRCTIRYCTSATKVGVWPAIFIPSSAALSLLPSGLPLTLDFHRFATTLFLPSPRGLATKQPLWHATVKRLLCVSPCRRKQTEGKREREGEREKWANSIKNTKNAPRVFSTVNPV